MTQSYWITSTKETKYPSLNQDIKVDVVIIGGGIAGITSSALLQEAGLSVALIEANQIARGTTGHTTAKITSQHNIIYSDLIKYMGVEKAKQYADANQQSIRKIHQLVKHYTIDCDLVMQKAHVYTNKLSNVSTIEKEVKAAKMLGLPADYVTDIDYPFKTLSGIQFSEQAAFHPRKYLLNLAAELYKKKVQIYEHTRALDIIESDHCTVTTDGGKITADYVVVATHFPFYDKGSFYFGKMYAETSYIVGVKTTDQFNLDMFISYDRPTRSLRSYSSLSDHLILVGGESHKTGKGEGADAHYSHLEYYFNSILPHSSSNYRWLAQDYITLDKVPYIGLLNSDMKNVYVATGFGKWGMTGGTAAGMIITDLIVKGKNPWASIFSPSRHLDVQKIKQFVVNGADSAYELIKGKITSHQASLRNIKKGEGKIIEIDGNNIGVYRDEEDQLFAVDITCRHLKCELIWNQTEKTWDCPCHGSRYNYKGEVIDGPANQNLIKIDLSATSQ